MENNEQNQNKNTDPKPHIFYFNGDFETMCQVFFKKIKPIVGIVKYKMVNWDKFPLSQTEAQSLSVEWNKKFESNELYSEFKVGIYFHLTSKTIRFELKHKKIIIELKSSDLVEEVILSHPNYIPTKTIQFECEKTNYFENFNLEMCKTKGKEIADKLELSYPPNKFVVFLNQNANTITVTTK